MEARILMEDGSLDSHIARAVRIDWLREPTTEELHDFKSFVETNSLAALCRLLLNSNEFLFVD